MTHPHALRARWGWQAAGGSIPASEHSTITSWGVDGEVDAMRRRRRVEPVDSAALLPFSRM